MLYSKKKILYFFTLTFSFFLSIVLFHSLAYQPPMLMMMGRCVYVESKIIIVVEGKKWQMKRWTDEQQNKTIGGVGWVNGTLGCAVALRAKQKIVRGNFFELLLLLPLPHTYIHPRNVHTHSFYLHVPLPHLMSVLLAIALASIRALYERMYTSISEMAPAEF